MNGGTLTPPRGDVTFVFSDIEGSTAHLRRLGDRYPAMLEDHRRLLRQAWANHGGFEVGTEGDSFLVAFATAEQAVKACVAGQRALHDYDWPDDVMVRVRMGAHRGHAIPRGSDYVALAVHQAARIAAAACGSQVLLSNAVAQACSETPGIQSIGEWRVRDFDTPIELFVVADKGLGLKTSTPRLVPAAGHNIALPLTSFVDREHEGDTLERVMMPRSLVTITGPGGVGKTRLAKEAGLKLTKRFGDGVSFVSLEGLTGRAGVETAVLTALGLGGDPTSVSRRDTIVEHLRFRKALIIFDNCDAVGDHVAALAAELLEHADSVAMLATSRQPLGSPTGFEFDETVVRLAPLAVATDGSDQTEAPAVNLFLDRASGLDRTIGAGADPAIVELCMELDCLPLAIEIAASWAEVLSPAELRDAFADPDTRRSVSASAIGAGSRSIGTVIDSSLVRLDAGTRRDISSLAAFPATFTIDAAHAALGPDRDPIATRLMLSEVVRRSLVIKDRVEGAPRFRLLNLVREHIQGVTAATDLADTQVRIAKFFRARFGPPTSVDRHWISQMHTEIANIAPLIFTDSVDPADRCALAWSVGSYRDATSQYRLGIAELTRFLAAESSEPPGRVPIMAMLADLAMRVGDLNLAEQHLARAEALAASLGPPPWWDDAAISRSKAAYALWQGDAAECLRIARLGLESGLSARGRARLHDTCGIALMELSDPAGAAAEFTIELELWHQLGFESKVCTTLGNLAEAHLQLGDRVSAALHQADCLKLARELGDETLVAHSMAMAAQLAARADRWHRALSLQRGADSIYERLGLRLFTSDEKSRQAMLSAASEYERADNAGELSSTDQQVSADLLIDLTTEELARNQT